MKKKRCQACGWVHRKSAGRGKGRQGSTNNKWSGGKPTCTGFTIAGKRVD